MVIVTSSNVFLSCQEDDIRIELRGHIGVDRILRGADYPHSESTLPRSREIPDPILEGVPAEDRAQIVCDNTARLYGFNLDRIAMQSPNVTES
jgi:hypothetical protein